ncbi:hypothetical protein [Streptomyces sp. NPDC060184]|uniref:hypothetical protein n=1 Tax=Streptomyces sp. NPDC060184 TaxID=3347064 RepID=UPI00364E2FD9
MAEPGHAPNAAPSVPSAGRAAPDARRDRPRGRIRRAAGVPLVALLLAGLMAAGGCAAPDRSADSATAGEIGAVLDRRAAAVLDHDTAGYLAVVDPDATALRAAQRTSLADLAQVPLRSWTYTVKSVTARGAGRVTADVELDYRVAGFDTAPATARRTLELARDGSGGSWYLTADRPAKDAAVPLWDQGPVTAVHGTHSLVLGVGRPAKELREIAETADLAVPAVSAAWPDSWAARVVYLVPASTAAMAELLGSPDGSYRGIAAVTTGAVSSGNGRPGLADRVVVNPEAYAGLGTFGRRVVLTHETTHVATRTSTTAATPLWLSEGFADWAAYRQEDRTAGEIAPELATAVRARDLPAALPADDDFAFDRDADALARAYEGGWLACVLVAEEWGEDALTDLYRAVGAHDGREGAVDTAMEKVLGIGEREFTTRWRDYLTERLG